MPQHFHILTLTHRQSDLKIIGRLAAAFAPEGGQEERVGALMERQAMDECFYLATCNRITWFFTTQRTIDRDFKVNMVPDPALAEVQEKLVHYQGREALMHLCEVAASVDSLVVGERQILGQLREAYERARAWGHTGDDLRVIFDKIVVAAKDVYANTRIGEKSVSVVSLAVRKLLQLVPRRDARVLLVGAGQTNHLVAKFLRKYEYHRVTVFNRSLPKAAALARTFPASVAHTLDQLEHFRGGFDVMVVCTAAVDPIVNEKNFKALLNGESPRGKLIIDLAIPSNVAEIVVAHRAEGLHYVGVEDLRQLARENMGFRSREILLARDILSNHIDELERGYRQRKLERAMSHLPVEIKEVRRRAIDQVFARELEELDPAARELLEKVTLYMEKKCIGIPMKAAREALIE